MTIYALLTNQATAAAETALCPTHLRSETARVHALNNAADDVVRTTFESLADASAWIDCSGNDALACIECGSRG